MKKITFFLMVLLAISLLVGCTGNADVDIKSSGNEADIDIETEEGEQHIEVSGKNTDEWCAEGSTWSSTGTQGSAKMVVVGIETSGKYKGYCHVKYDMDSAGAQANADYYFDEDGNGYQIIEMNGQTFESEWTG